MLDTHDSAPRTLEAARPDSVAVVDGLRANTLAWTEDARAVLDTSTLAALVELHRTFEPQRRALLEERAARQAAIDAGELPDYEPADRGIAFAPWRVAPLPGDLLRRRVEITGPINDAKMVINMLSPGPDGRAADAAMLDFEDSMAPTWSNFVAGLHNLRGAVNGTLSFEKRDGHGRLQKIYRVDRDSMPLLMVRVRGLHLLEPNLTIDDQPVAAGMLDLVAAVAQMANELLELGRTPMLYIPKCEHPQEARWWNALLAAVEQRAGLPKGAVRVTLLIETLPAAFHLERILYELCDRAAALNVGRWDKIFSDIKVLREHPDRVIPDRATVSMARPWMRAYAARLVRVCHRRGVLAIGGMAAFTPGRSAARRREQTERVVADKHAEHALGHDGCWVSHPYFIGPALDQFPRDNQLSVLPEVESFPDLLPEATGPCTLEGLRTNVRAGIAYLKGWNEGIGCVAWDDLMEDLATLEISRTQTWQWTRHGVRLDDGSRVTRRLVKELFDTEGERILREVREALAGSDPATVEAECERFRAAAHQAQELYTETSFRDFLTDRSALVRNQERNTDRPLPGTRHRREEE